MTRLLIIIATAFVLGGCAAEVHHGKTGWIDFDSTYPGTVVEVIQDEAGNDVGMYLNADFAAATITFDPTTGAFTATEVKIERTPQVLALPEVLRASGEYVAAWADILAEWAAIIDQIGDIANPAAGAAEFIE